MLIKYTFNNYRSFYDNDNGYEYDLIAPGGKVMKRYPDNYMSLDNGYDLLKSSVIVGENAGGKSNFIESLKYLKTLFAQNDRVRSVRPYINSISLSHETKPVQRFTLTVAAANNRIYEYHLEISEKGIVSESLKYQNKIGHKPVTVLTADFHGDAAQITANERYADALRKTSGNIGLTVAKLALMGDDNAAEFVAWMNDNLETDIPDKVPEGDMLRTEGDIRILKSEGYLPIFSMVDDSIVGLIVDENKPFDKTVIIRENAEGERYERELQYDSAGVKDFFSWAIQIYRVVYEDKVVFADEMDRVLNPILSSKIIAFINGSDHHGQFIFTTHNVLHLDLKTYMKEQIYFITKPAETLISQLYSLADFPAVRYDMTRVYEFYLKGILGGTTK